MILNRRLLQMGAEELRNCGFGKASNRNVLVGTCSVILIFLSESGFCVRRGFPIEGRRERDYASVPQPNVKNHFPYESRSVRERP